MVFSPRVKGIIAGYTVFPAKCVTQTENRISKESTAIKPLRKERVSHLLLTLGIIARTVYYPT